MDVNSKRLENPHARETPTFQRLNFRTERPKARSVLIPIFRGNDEVFESGHNTVKKHTCC